MRSREHPSDRLCRGGVSFEDALELVEQEWATERAIAARGVEDAAFLMAMEQGHEQVNAALRHASRVWGEEQERARLRTVERLREDVHAAEAALDDEAARWLELLAASLEDGDYSRLAI